MNTVKLTYFKQSGKLYTSVEIVCKTDDFLKVIELVESMLRIGKRPGLVDGHDGFDVLIEFQDSMYLLKGAA